MMRIAGIIALSSLSSSTTANGETPTRRPFADASARFEEPRSRDFDLHHLRLELRLDVANRAITASAIQTFTPLRDGLTTLRLDAVALDIKTVVDHANKPLSWSQRGDHLDIELDHARAIGVRFEVRIDYAARPRVGLFFVAPDPSYPDKPTTVWSQGEMEDTRHWIPTWDYPNDRTTTEILATVPEAWTAVSNGRLVSVTSHPEDNTRTFHWSQETAHVTYLISLVAGEMEVSEETDENGVLLQYYVPRGQAAFVERSFKNTPRMMKFFASFTGVAYPWAKYAQVVVPDFTFGGMENTSATTLTDRTLHDDRAHSDYQSEGLVAHELAHQWFGDLVTCRSWAHLWLNEGFATYLDALWAEHDLGADEMAMNLLEKEDAYFEQDQEDWRRPILEKMYTDPSDLFDRHAYQKGARVLHMLRNTLGDADFRRGVSAYLTRNRDRVVETDELRFALEDATGRSLGWFFDQWVLKPGYPELAVEANYDATAALVALRVRQAQSTMDGTPHFRLPMTVRVWTAGGMKDFAIQFSASDQVVYLPSSEPPTGVLIDPGHALLMRVTLDSPDSWLKTQIEQSPAAIDRITAIRALATRTSPVAIELLAGSLASDPFWGVRAEAAKSLGKTRSSAALRPLVAALADGDSRVRRGAAEGLATLKNREAVPALLRALGDDASYYARGEAAKALGQIGGDGVYDPLVGALTQESHNDIVRSKAFEGLAELGDKRAIVVAAKWSAYGRPPKAREAAIKALGKLGKGDAKVRLELETLLAADPYIWARQSAIKALKTLGDAAAIPALEKAARNELDGRLRREARRSADALRAPGPTPSEERLRKVEEELRQVKAELEATRRATQP